MKVSTDACIQGAWTPIPERARRACDIGCGTALLSLMLAQRKSDLQIDAIELEARAAVQAAQNILDSPYADRVQLIHADVRGFVPMALYDLIICNPPFFENSLQSNNQARMQARHTDTLSYRELATFIAGNLAEEGIASVLLPATQEQSWLSAASEASLVLRHQLEIRALPHKAPNRMVFVISRQQTAELQLASLLIYREPGNYTESFKELLSPFYLHL